MNLIRLEDELNNGGNVTSASETMKFGGRPVARKGDRLVCKIQPAVVPNVIEEGDETMCDEGIPLARHGHKGTCGCSLISSIE